MTSLAYDSRTNTVCADFVTPWNGGTGQFQIVVRFDNFVFDGTEASNVATVSSDQTNFTTPPVVITASNVGIPPPTLTTGVYNRLLAKIF